MGKPKQLTSLLKKIYFDISQPGSFGGIQRLLKQVRSQTTKSVSEEDVRKFLEAQPAYTLHKPLRKKYPRLRFDVDGPEVQLQADLIDYHSIQDANDGFRYLLVIVDCFSRKAWVEPLRTKSALDVLAALKRVFERLGFVPQKFQTDSG